MQNTGSEPDAGSGSPQESCENPRFVKRKSLADLAANTYNTRGNRMFNDLSRKHLHDHLSRLSTPFPLFRTALSLPAPVCALIGMDVLSWT
jgi:hypothetical protein